MSHPGGDTGREGPVNRSSLHPVSSRPTSEYRPVDFSNPPVAETILGVQFTTLRRLTIPYLGLYWSQIRERYPGQEVRPPLSPVIEDFASAVSSEKSGIEVTAELDVRCWFIDASSTQLIQIQRDRFIRNWRKRPPPHDAYPHYNELRPRFEEDWSHFVTFLERESLGTPEVNQCEVTYINHVEIGPNELGEADRVLTLLKPQEASAFLPSPEMVILSARYVIPERRGRLHIAAQPAIRRQDSQPVLQLTLTARGRPDSPRLPDILSWFDLGHDWIVHGFVDVTTPAMHETWGRR